jgi:hypothetical protein
MRCEKNNKLKFYCMYDVVSPDSLRGHADKSAARNLSTSLDLTALF